MIPIEFRIENEGESLTLDFKKEGYGKAKQEFLKDVIAMANALSNDLYRYIVIGVKETLGEKEYFEVNREQIGDVANYHQLIDQNIEPTVPFNIKYVKIGEKTICVFEIGPCDNPPYLFKKDNKPFIQGNIFIRNGTSTRFVNRKELDMMYLNKQKVKSRDILVGFNENLDHSIELPTLSEDEYENVPSCVEEWRIKNEISKRKSPMYSELQQLKLNVSAINHHDIFHEIPINRRTKVELIEMLENTKEKYRIHDGYYIFEQLGQHINIHVHNQGVEPLRNCKIRVTFPTIEGLNIADKIYENPEDKFHLFNGKPYYYFDLEKTDTSYIVTDTIDIIRQKLPTTLLNKNIRIALAPNLANTEIPIHYQIFAENFPDVICGDLIIKVIEK